jgi:hypothetical protein
MQAILRNQIQTGRLTWKMTLNQRKRPESLLKRTLALSWGDKTRLELFGSEFDDWPAAIMQSMLDVA